MEKQRIKLCLIEIVDFEPTSWLYERTSAAQFLSLTIFDDLKLLDGLVLDVSPNLSNYETLAHQ